MKRKVQFFVTLILALGLLLTQSHSSQAQGVGINEDQSEPHQSAMLDVKSNNKGVLIPRMSSKQRDAIPMPAIGLMVFDNTTLSFWYYEGTQWTEVAVNNGQAKSSTGDDLGNHTATANIQTADHYISNDGDNEGIYVAADGKVGIGTNSPNTDLHVRTYAPSVRFESSANGRYFNFQPSGGTIDMYNSYFQINRYSNQPIILGRGGGNVGVGLASGAPSHKLHVAGSVRIADGTQQNNYVLTSNANGVGTWKDPNTLISAGGSGSWDHIATTNIQSNGHYISNDGDNEGIYVDTAGNVGIGTNNPTNALLEVSGAQPYGDGLIYNSCWRIYYTHLNEGASYYVPNDEPLSIYADNGIAGGSILVLSDQRIKTNCSATNTTEDLATLMQIKVTDYEFIDKVAKGDRHEKKVIAQELKEIYPQAVKDDLIKVVPDIMKFAPAKEGWVSLADHGLAVGETIRLIHAKGEEELPVLAVDGQRFQVAFQGDEEVLVYGRKVNDFHIVDYDAVAMLNVSATQAQQLLIEQLQQANKTLSQENAGMKARLEKLEALQYENKALTDYKASVEQRLEKLEALLGTQP